MDQNQSSPDQRFEARKEAIEAKQTIETYAAAAVAQTNLERGGGQIYNSYDAADRDGLDVSRQDRPSFMRVNQGNFGINDEIAQKWRLDDQPSAQAGRDSSKDDGDFNQMNTREVKSELDAKEQEVKRNNLIDLFLRGTEVDKYIINNLYGKDKYTNVNNPNQTIGE